MSAINRDFSLGDLDQTLRGNSVDGCVVVQASNSSLETADLLAATLPETVVAIVGWTDLESESVAERIEELRSAPNGRHLAGVRHLAHIDPDPGWLRRPAVGRGLEALARAGLSFDLVVTAGQLRDCAWLAAEHPELTFILDHLGKPALRENYRSEWEPAIRALASCPNVFAKLSGLTMEANWRDWTVDDLAGSVHTALEAFGSERLMFGSDWPLVEVCGGYSAWIGAARELLGGLSESEQHAVFESTVRSAYRIAEPRDA